MRTCSTPRLLAFVVLRDTTRTCPSGPLDSRSLPFNFAPFLQRGPGPPLRPSSTWTHLHTPSTPPMFAEWKGLFAHLPPVLAAPSSSVTSTKRTSQLGILFVIGASFTSAVGCADLFGLFGRGSSFAHLQRSTRSRRAPTVLHVHLNLPFTSATRWLRCRLRTLRWLSMSVSLSLL